MQACPGDRAHLRQVGGACRLKRLDLDAGGVGCVDRRSEQFGCSRIAEVALQRVERFELSGGRCRAAKHIDHLWPDVGVEQMSLEGIARGELYRRGVVEAQPLGQGLACGAAGDFGCQHFDRGHLDARRRRLGQDSAHRHRDLGLVDHRVELTKSTQLHAGALARLESIDQEPGRGWVGEVVAQDSQELDLARVAFTAQHLLENLRRRQVAGPRKGDRGVAPNLPAAARRGSAPVIPAALIRTAAR